MFENYLQWIRLTHVLVLVFLAGLFFHSDLMPLEETHWDSPIYLQLSKRAAETNTLADYHQYAKDIPLGPGDGAHWYFMRIGHILLLSEITRLFGANESALIAMQWLYRVFMALGIALAIVLSHQIIKLFKRNALDSNFANSFWWVGYLFAAITYIASDSYRGLQGHFVSEPPAFLILVLFAIALLKAIERDSLFVASSAGVLLFLLFFIRVDAVLPGVIFLVLIACTLIFMQRLNALSVIAATSLVSLFLYLVYAWWFYPLVNPQVLLEFSSDAKEVFFSAPLKSIFSIVIAGGLLWVGACVGALRWREPIILFAMIWLLLSLLPLLIDSLSERAVQSRMAFYIVLPLLILAGEGWRRIIQAFTKQKRILPVVLALSVTLMIALIPYSMILNVRNFAVTHLPSEIQQYLFTSLVRRGNIQPNQQSYDSKLGLFVRPMYERWTIEFLKAKEIGDYLYAFNTKAYLTWSGAPIGQHSLQSYVELLRYFGKKNSGDESFVIEKRPNDSEPCTEYVPTNFEPIVFCSTLTASDIQFLKENRGRLYVFSAEGYEIPGLAELKLKKMLSIPPFVLYETTE
ncbi:hypothetical protein W03_19460 [Nitrosomonas sp. PY1]|uniref:hypothetical protein n=1 Tax=Nitrosomonas sp. PY1 TaxID=1803906 RepID=UPI001FC884C5|nr:hypothetical protein [Nitrosomonas sp. PY1]GKS69942.1 hypothetical protein W03_19460 [Nitrosomonas sp. PY1]